MKKIIFCCMTIFLVSFISNVIAAPAGVTNGLNLWLKADDSANTTINASNEITLWGDSSGNGYDFTNTANYPSFVQDLTDEKFNFNPYLDFKGTRFLTISGATNLADADTQTIFVVMHKRANNQGLFQFEDSTNATTWIAMQSFIIDGEGKADFHTANVPSNISIITGGRNAVDGDNTQDGFYNGAIYSYPPDLQADNTFNITSGTATLGRSSGFNGYSGMLGEFIIYNKALTDNESQKINTYLALKYGITFQGGVNYIAANGAILWDMSGTFTYKSGANTGDYNNNIAGIIRDDANDLNQTKSKSVNNGSIITMEQTSLADGQAVLWGHDGFALSNVTGEYVTNQIVSSNYNFTAGKRVQREWKVRNTSGVSVNMQVDVSGFSLSSDMVLMIDSDGLGNNSDTPSAYDIVVTADSNDGSSAIFSNVTFPDNAVFTFGDEQILYDVLGLSDTSSSSDEVSFSWTYPDNIADSFTISESGTNILTVDSTTRSYSQAASCNTSYTFEIFATNPTGDSTPRSITVKSSACLSPPVVTEPEITEPTPTSPQISNNGLPKTPKLGIVIIPTSNHRQISGDLTILKAGVVTGGSLENQNQSGGLISNVELLPNSLLIGGKMSGSNQSQGTVQDIHLTRYSDLTGGVGAGQIDNNGVLKNLTIAEQGVLKSSLGTGALNGWVRNFGTIKGLMTLQAGSSLFGGVIDGEIIGNPSNPPFIGMAQIAEGSTLKNVRLSPTTVLPAKVTLINVILPNDIESPDLQDFNLDPTQLSQLTAAQMRFEPTIWGILDRHELALIPAEAFAGIVAESMQFMSPRVINNLSIEQFSYIPITAFSGLTRYNLASFNFKTIGLLTEEHLAALNLEEWQNTIHIGKIIANLNPELVDINTIPALLPEAWEIDLQTGALTAPVGSRVNFASFSNNIQSNNINLPFIIDANSHFGFAGLGAGNTMLNNLNRMLRIQNLDELDLSKFIFTQNEFGIINIVGTDENTGIVLAFMPDANNIEQVSLNIEVGISILENGYFQMITPSQQKIVLIPAPTNPVDLQRALGQSSEITLSPEGDVIMNFNQTEAQAEATTRRKTRFETNVMMVGVFDAFVEPASNYCAFNCGFGMAFPTNFRMGNLRARSEGQITYADGSKQKIYPTVVYPSRLVDLLQQIDNVEKVLYQADGSFIVNLKQPAETYQLEADFNLDITRLKLGEKRQINIKLQAIVDELFLIYQVQYEDLWLQFNLLVSKLN
ncbi:MAG: hypothetical protein VSS52_007235 [Thiotrichaceae bacterium]|nr:hypothetical protein [Thiotrichaceae bacterium]